MLVAKDIDAVASMNTGFSDRQRAALRSYLDNANDLSIEFTDIAIAPHGSDVAVTFTRRDRFVDAQSGRPVRLEVRLTKVLAREQSTWKIGGGQ